MSILRRLFSPSLAYDGEVRELTEFDFVTVEDKLNAIRALIKLGSENPLVREFTADVLRYYGTRPRDFRAQVDAVQRWARDNLYYLWEHRETFQTAAYTILHRYGDCDDFAICTGAMLESIDIPTQLEILGEVVGPNQVSWKHIYLRAGLPPKHPTEWIVVECTIPQADLDFEPSEYARALQAGAKGHTL